jgi:acetyltransferase
LNVEDEEQLLRNFDKLMQIKDAKSVLIQPMYKGLEIFVGAKKEGNFPHIVMCGLGGIYIEAFKDVSSCTIPVSKMEAKDMIFNLKSYPILKGIRGQKGIDLNEFEVIIRKISSLLQLVPEITELDMNPLLASSDQIIAVDARIRLN